MTASIVNGLAFDEYAAHPGINASAIKAGKKSMLAMRHAITSAGTRTETPALKLGRIIHARLLDRTLPVVWNGRRAGKEWDKFAADNDGSDIVTADELDQISACVQRVRDDAIAGPLLDGCIYEASVFWTGKAYGEAKARPDAYNATRRILIDVKTTRDASIGAFVRQAFNLQYHVQMAWYRIGLEAAGVSVTDTYVIAVEPQPPFDVVVYRYDEAALEQGAADAVKIASEYRACCAAGKWPGCGGGELRALGLPTWAVADIELE